LERTKNEESATFDNLWYNISVGRYFIRPTKFNQQNQPIRKGEPKMSNLETQPTVELVKEYTRLEYEIQSKILLYHNIYEELVRRFPTIKEDIKPKQFIKKL
jgi:hypothetical protein